LAPQAHTPSCQDWETARSKLSRHFTDPNFFGVNTGRSAEIPQPGLASGDKSRACIIPRAQVKAFVAVLFPANE
jgi:hypothetical protein